MFRHKKSTSELLRERAAEQASAFLEKVAPAADTARERAYVAAETARDKVAPAAGTARERAHAAKEAAKERAAHGVEAAAPRLEEAVHNLSPRVDDARDRLVDDVLPRIAETLAALAAGAAATKSAAADTAKIHAPEVKAAFKGETIQRRKKGGKLLTLLGLAAAGVAAYAASKQGTKQDPWAVPAADPYTPPTSGRASTTGASVQEKAASLAEAAKEKATEVKDAAAAKAAEVKDAATAKAEEAKATVANARDDRTVPAVGETSEGADLSTPHLGTDPSLDATPTAEGSDAWTDAKDWTEGETKA
ncbi:hypothetical protein [Janibacter sp. G1551]|uniref:hypothetical protein n=1 Tax=Janibacter sp. G1551 TaxID=3420440 RepID=UPI003D0731CD